jgi:hypothetical protein
VGEALLVRAQQRGAADPEVAIGDLLKLVNAISLASEREAELAGRLLNLIIRGVAPARGA